MLVITGLGRSGTSCLIGYCEQLELVASAKWFDSINAGGENHEVTEINNAILVQYKRKKKTFNPDDFVSRIQAIEDSVIKDPRFTWNCPVILSTWKHARTDLRFLVSHRDFKSVAASKTATNGSSLRWTLECMYVYSRFMLRLSDLNLPFLVLKYPEYLEDYDRVYEALATFGSLAIDYDHGYRVWSEWIDLEKVHY